MSLDDNKKEVFGKISYMKMGTEIVEIGGRELENCSFNFYFLNQDISFNNHNHENLLKFFPFLAIKKTRTKTKKSET